MVKHVVDYDDYDEKDFESYDGDPPKPGVYEFKLQSFNEHTTSDDAIRWIFVCQDEPYKGWPGFVYSNMSTAKWKTQQIVKALQGGKEKKLVIDTDKPEKLLKLAKPVLGRVKADFYEDEQRAKLTVLMPLDEVAKRRRLKKQEDELEDEEDLADDAEEIEDEDVEEEYDEDEVDDDDEDVDDEEDEDEDDEEEDDDEEEEEEEPAPPPRRAKKAAKAPPKRAAKKGRKREAF